MGCGGSKHDVATGNTSTTRRGGLIRKKPSDAACNASAASTDTTGNLRAPTRPANVKDITVSSANGVDAGEGGKLLSHSPDRYFSSRKDDEAADPAAVGGEYFSPRYEPDVVGDQATAKEFTDLAAEGAAGSTTAAAAAAAAGAAEDGGQALGGAAPKEDEGMLINGELHADLKETILVEETKFEVVAAG